MTTLSTDVLRTSKGPAVSNTDAVLVFYQGTLLSGEEFDANFDFSSFDARTSTAAQRRLFINESRESVSLIEQHCAGFAVVAPSPLVRGVITAIRWFITEPCPVKVVATRAEAHQWCSDQLLAWAQQPPSREPVESFAE